MGDVPIPPLLRPIDLTGREQPIGAPPVTTPRRKPTRARALGVSDDDYSRMLAAQDGHCALCPNRAKSRRLHTDHDHLDPAHPVRGLLCMRCNRNLPTWVDPDWLIRAALYLDPAQDDVIARGRAVSYAMTRDAP